MYYFCTAGVWLLRAPTIWMYTHHIRKLAFRSNFAPQPTSIGYALIGVHTRSTTTTVSFSYPPLSHEPGWVFLIGQCLKNGKRPTTVRFHMGIRAFCCFGVK